MIILGIDPGYERCGVAILQKDKKGEELLFSDCLKTSSKLSFPERLFILGKEIEKIIKNWKPDTMAIEKVYFTTNQKTAMQVAETKGMITYLGLLYNMKIKEFTPLEIKIALTGYGKADKKQVENMVKALLKSEKKAKNDDEMDAVAVALTCASHKTL